mmetsp:Transcript_14552/g.29427  ORF Transcript_14552/g.29427 Transcript_14552/m.29427 type:complete len:305 (+) Transcript_14552:1489-2403(+)
MRIIMSDRSVSFSCIFLSYSSESSPPAAYSRLRLYSLISSRLSSIPDTSSFTSLPRSNDPPVVRGDTVRDVRDDRASRTLSSRFSFSIVAILALSASIFCSNDRFPCSCLLFSALSDLRSFCIARDISRNSALRLAHASSLAETSSVMFFTSISSSLSLWRFLDSFEFDRPLGLGRGLEKLWRRQSIFGIDGDDTEVMLRPRGGSAGGVVAGGGGLLGGGGRERIAIFWSFFSRVCVRSCMDELDFLCCSAIICLSFLTSCSANFTFFSLVASLASSFLMTASLCFSCCEAFCISLSRLLTTSA